MANSEGRDELSHFIRVCALFREKHYILEINKISKAENTLITIKHVCFVFCWNILEIFFSNIVGSVGSRSILFAALLAMDLIGRLNASGFANGGMPLAKVSLRWSVKDFRREIWTRGPNFVSSLHLHPYFVYISNKG